MCRIAGILNKNADINVLAQKVKTMCKVLEHGGPDDEGIFVSENGLVLGHRRLSIIDLSKNGHQPMADVDKKVWITFNGEIYNYLQLKTELLHLGAAFNSDTDTEVILQAYLHWGTGCFTKLRGMFAFALYDIERDLTYLVRDSNGIKPLYFHIKKGELSFASEVKAFKAAGIATEENIAWRMRFLAFGHVPEPETTLSKVSCLEKGSVLCWDNKRQTSTIDYYVATTPVATINSLADAREAIAVALRAAVQRQLIADAPIGVFLSGGIDSSLITLLATEQKREQLKTISIFFKEETHNEFAFQKIINDKVGGENYACLIERKHFDSQVNNFVRDMDMPTTDGINSWFICRYAQQAGLKAVLSGLGADELFGGYPSFNRISLLKMLQKIPASILNASEPLLNARYKKISYLSRPGLLSLYLSMRAIFTITEVAKLLDADEEEVEQAVFGLNLGIEKGLSDKQLASWLERNLYMQNQLLKDTDVMSMAHGLEVRVPFLDEDFQNVVRSIAPELLFDKQQPKKLLIDSFKDVLPKPIWSRQKMGFSFPLQIWMRENNHIANTSHYKNKYAQKVISDFKNNKVHWSKAFAVYLTQLHV